MLTTHGEVDLGAGGSGQSVVRSDKHALLGDGEVSLASLSSVGSRDVEGEVGLSGSVHFSKVAIDAVDLQKVRVLEVS